MHVANLNEIAFRDYTWMDIRDALRKQHALMHGISSFEHIAFALAFVKSKKEGVIKSRAESYSGLFVHFMDNRHKTEYLSQEIIDLFTHVEDITEELSELLIANDLISASKGRHDHWELTEKGGGLFRQKSVRRISHKDAGKKLTKVLAAARAFNEDATQSYTISRIVLFGSMIHGDKQDVGDIDILLKVDPRYNGLSREEWRKQERAILKTERPSAFNNEFRPTREDNARKAIKKVSPYISIEPWFGYEYFEKDGVPMMVIFDMEEPATKNRETLAAAIGCPDLASHAWDQK